MADKDQVDQSISHDDQNYNFDMDAIYKDFIREIDSVRSHATFNKDNAEGFLKALDPEQKIIKQYNTNIEESYQESRAHAFFRLIGLPVISSDGSSYSPGHDNIKEDRKIKLKTKINIALKPIDDFDKLTAARENYIQSMLKIFSKPSSIDAGCMVVSSGGTGSQGSPNIRLFNSSFEKSVDALDMNADNQSYEIKTVTMIGNQAFLLSEFQDATGTKPKISQNKKHIIKPLIVNGKIDFTVSPSTRRVCVPFVYDKTNTMIVDNVFGKRPLIEKLIRDKLQASSKKGTEEQRVVDYIKNFSKIKDAKIIDKISSSDYDYLDREKFANSLKMIKEMVKKLVEAADEIKKAQGKYYWIPQPSIVGPEQGCSVVDIFFPSSDDGANLLTELDRSILYMTAKNMLNKISTSSVEDKDDAPEDFAFSNFSNTFNKDTTEAMGNASQESLEKISNNRKSALGKANEAARVVEIIMGEFSGLGLCDIFAITGALDILSIEDLIGLIDVDAYARMQKILGIDLTGLTIPSPKDAVKNLTSIVKDFYTIMDQIYINELYNNSVHI